MPVQELKSPAGLFDDICSNGFAIGDEEWAGEERTGDEERTVEEGEGEERKVEKR